MLGPDALDAPAVRQSGAQQRALTARPARPRWRGAALTGEPAPLAVPQDVQGDGRGKAFLEEALVGSRVIEGEKLLMRSVKLLRGAGQGQLVVIQPALDVQVGLHQIHVALPLSTDNG